MGGGLWLAVPSGDDGVEAQTACTQGPDCTVLLAVQAELEGRSPDALNWSADIPMTSWYGVELTDGRVQGFGRNASQDDRPDSCCRTSR